MDDLELLNKRPEAEVNHLNLPGLCVGELLGDVMSTYGELVFVCRSIMSERHDVLRLGIKRVASSSDIQPKSQAKLKKSKHHLPLDLAVDWSETGTNKGSINL